MYYLKYFAFVPSSLHEVNLLGLYIRLKVFDSSLLAELPNALAFPENQFFQLSYGGLTSLKDV